MLAVVVVMAYPCGLPAWIVNSKLSYLEPVPVPSVLAEYYYFVYLRTSVPDPSASFSAASFKARQRQTLSNIHQADLKEYKKAVAAWKKNRKECQKFLELEREMKKLQPLLKTPLLKGPKIQIRKERRHLSIPMPKFICNQFLFADEPVEPPKNVIEYFCYYERNWEEEEREPFDQDPEVWSALWKRQTGKARQLVEKNLKDLINNFVAAHDVWLSNLGDLEDHFKKYKNLRDEIKRLCPQN